jgi:recombination protein RecR
VHEHVRECRVCADLCASELCDVCRDPRRDRRIVCVVAQPQDRIALEKSGAYRGLYHVLHGVLDPLGGVGPDQLRVRELLARLASSAAPAATATATATAAEDAPANDASPRPPRGTSAPRLTDGDEIAEVIVATSPNVEGDATALYLSRLLAPLGVRVTRIASGVAVGGELEYADLSTLQRALADRRSL